ncbi:MAG: hypothetical protein WEB37_06135 [Bacteroidota bacterium]
MKRNTGSLTDKGCWISHDRIYAFVSAEHGITEVGYHGLQPVSRNSRILVREAGVLTFSIRLDGSDHALQTEVIDWEPTRIKSETVLPNGTCSLVIAAAGRRLAGRFSANAKGPVTACVQLAKQAAFHMVHGERTWTPFRQESGKVVTSFRDSIMLQPWLRRTGPYAGDFLIPDPIRKKIFSTTKRSGLATPADLRPEFRDADFALYDAEGFVAFGGDEWTTRESGEFWIFERTIDPHDTAEFTVLFSDKANYSPAEHRPPVGHTLQSRLHLPGFPHFEDFIETVPGLVDSCIVQDYGIPRACPGRYYWIWAWDSLVTMQEALRWGDHRNVVRTTRFIEQHRDEEGRIPSRWTRSLSPLDTPSPGGIEFLHAALAYEAFLETNDVTLLKLSFPSYKTRFEAAEQELLREGLVRGEGFYPDLLSAFGRNDQSSVCMEVGSWYAFSRILENMARLIGERDLEERAGEAASAIARNFSSRYWDTNAGFFTDSIDVGAKSGSPFHPLFALLFLQSPLGLSLIRPHIREAAAFIERELVTKAGIRVIPLRETGPTGEDVLDSWYPHWDFYALKVLRRAGRTGAIMQWLECAEEVLRELGYCPEFLALKGFRELLPEKWEHHGSASNLNCVTSWHRSIREAIAGFEFDPGGITHIPLSLPLNRVRMEGCVWRGGTWTFETRYDGHHFESLSIDGTIIEGCLKIPSVYHTKGNHTVTARYGNTPMLPCFAEIMNAAVLSSRRLPNAVEVEIEPMGLVETVFFSTEEPRVSVDGRTVPVRWEKTAGLGWFSFSSKKVCVLRLETR